MKATSFLLLLLAMRINCWGQNINKIEYYIDEDPGYGLATNIPITASLAINDLTFSIPMIGLTDGFHRVFVRAKDVSGHWSIVSSNPFQKITLSSVSIAKPIPNIIKIEYYIDNDPGYGLATNVAFTANQSINNLHISISTTNLTSGLHRIFIRAMDENRNWSLVSLQTLTISNNALVLGAIPSDFCRETTFNIPFFAGGIFNLGNIFTAQLSDINGNFTNPTTLGTLTSTVSGIIVATIPPNISVGTGYKIRVISSTPTISIVDEDMFNIISQCQCLLNMSLATGSWSNASIWSCGHIPLATEPIQISTGHTVTLDVNGAAKSLSILGTFQTQQNKAITIQGN